jgi:biopolymer transport protein ExbD
MQLPSSTRIGIFAIAFGILVFVPAYEWVQTRTLVPVDMPVRLSRGHIRTGDFKINMDGYFSIQIVLPYGVYPGCFYPEHSLRTRRLTSAGGQTVRAPGNDGSVTEGFYFGDFVGKPGPYNLDIEVLSETGSLDRCVPRLVIAGTSEEFNELNDTLFFLFLFFVFCEVLGIALAVLSLATHFRTRAFDSVRLKLGTESGPLTLSPEGGNTARLLVDSTRNRAAEPLSMGLCEGTPAYGITGFRHKGRPFRQIWSANPRETLNTAALIVVLALVSLLIPVWVLFGTNNRQNYGLLVSLPKEGVSFNSVLPGLTAPLIRVDVKGRVYLNQKETTWEELPSKLEMALRELPMRVVYFEGDAEAVYGDAARAIDVIEGAGARAILLTPGSRKENR